ncbi:ABC transporter ATP-binding protein [Xinfangfangia sp. CPCC 101601]|uniref:ABC transporter ATP-binding protein n=1 Tax=Pseudogemmobacter lacusdianii TaxID=3069608 RepID=A0ABU0VZ13_9RHOB|nr:ABC transporter ATP-binding protein [Xinfangfangia sp. CPCC 101601]MDQ2066995.1 ABC transporter ATP-binding protein [Xinfangfangia sp. CPCC 101601]
MSSKDQTAAGAETPRLELRDIGKTYPGVVANDAISLSVAPGEIHAILGENGAGKSTLMKIIYGAIQPDRGEILYDGQRLSHNSPAQARALGIEMVYQHFSLFETATVAENIALCLPGRMELAQLSARVGETAARYGLNVDPSRMVADLSMGERQQVEILRCLMRDPRLLILDEPTSVLAPQAVEQLFTVLRKIAEGGCSIIYISHKLDEVRALCQSATVLRGGRVTGTADPRQASAHDLAVMMIGGDLPVTEHPPAVLSVEPLLIVRNLSGRPLGDQGRALSDISLDLYGGEIVGIAGISGNGQAELAACLSGEATDLGAQMQLLGQPMPARADARRRLGLAYVPEERLGRGAVPGHTLTQNTILTGFTAGLIRRGMVRYAEARARAAAIIQGFSVKAESPAALASSLSGGNLQKFILGRELALDPKVLIVAQPTWGVDVGASAFIRQRIIDQSRKGAAVLVFSEELEELIEICDRIHVLSEGKLSPSIPRAESTKALLGSYMTGRGDPLATKEAP